MEPLVAADPALAKSDPRKFQRQCEVAEMVLGEDATDLGTVTHS